MDNKKKSNRKQALKNNLNHILLDNLVAVVVLVHVWSHTQQVYDTSTIMLCRFHVNEEIS